MIESSCRRVHKNCDGRFWPPCKRVGGVAATESRLENRIKKRCPKKWCHRKVSQRAFSSHTSFSDRFHGSPNARSAAVVGGVPGEGAVVEGATAEWAFGASSIWSIVGHLRSRKRGMLLPIGWTISMPINTGFHHYWGKSVRISRARSTRRIWSCLSSV